MRHRLTLAVLAALALALPASALGSDAAYEPNDGIQQAYGPLEANTNYDGTISTDNDRDWYIVYVSGQGVLNVSLNNLDDGSGCCGSPYVYLLNADGETLNYSYVEEGTTEELSYTTPGPGHYYVVVRGGRIPDNYRLRVSGPITTGPRPGPPDEVTPNNNPEAASAFGPLQGGRLYAGSIDAYNEEDWFYFYTSGPGAFDISLINLYDGSTYGGPSMDLFAADGEKRLNSASASPDRIDHIRYTTGGPAKFVLQVEGGSPVDRYQFRIDPAGLLTTVAPPAPPIVRAPAAPKITSGPAGRTASRSATIGFTGQAGVSFECKVTGQGVSGSLKSWSGCSSPARYTGLGLGSKIFRVRAVRGGKNSRAATWSWQVVKHVARKRLALPTTRRKVIFRAVCHLSQRCRARVKVLAGKRVLARGRYAVPPNKSRKVRISLTKTGRKILSRKRRVRGKLKIVDTRTHKSEAVPVVLKRRR